MLPRAASRFSPAFRCHLSAGVWRAIHLLILLSLLCSLPLTRPVQAVPRRRTNPGPLPAGLPETTGARRWPGC